MSLENRKIPSSLQDLDAQSALLCLDVEKFCQRLIGPLKNRILALAISGGADSVALAIIFHILAPRHSMILRAIHVNHCLRAEAGEDERFTRQLCTALGIPCHCARMDTKRIAMENSCGLEEAGRKGRYALFEKYRLECGCAHVLVAHHAGDLGEDIIMRLVRGCGWPALGGMKALQGNIFRPLLHVSPERLKNLLISRNIPWREDASNSSGEYRRNRIRHDIMPLLRKENPALENALLGLHEQADADTRYWNGMLEVALEKIPVNEEKREVFLSSEILDQLHESARLRLYHKVLENIRTFNKDAGARSNTLFMLDSALGCRHTGKIFQFPGKIKARIMRDGIKISF